MIGPLFSVTCFRYNMIELSDLCMLPRMSDINSVICGTKSSLTTKGCYTNKFDYYWNDLKSLHKPCDESSFIVLLQDIVRSLSYLFPFGFNQFPFPIRFLCSKTFLYNFKHSTTEICLAIRDWQPINYSDPSLNVTIINVILPFCFQPKKN